MQQEEILSNRLLQLQEVYDRGCCTGEDGRALTLDLSPQDSQPATSFRPSSRNSTAMNNKKPVPLPRASRTSVDTLSETPSAECCTIDSGICTSDTADSGIFSLALNLNSISLDSQNDEEPTPRPRPKPRSSAAVQSSPDIELQAQNENVKKLLEFALTRGFSQSDFDRTIDELGGEASKDKVLQKLMAVRSSNPPPLQTRTEGVEPDSEDDDDELRKIVIDGSNVAMAHGNGQVFSCKGIKLAVEWFKKRGHKHVTVFVPAHRLGSGAFKVADQQILSELKREGVMVLTPSSRNSEGRRKACYDDRFILKLASQQKSVVVSNDKFRDISREQLNYKETINQRLVPFAFAGDVFMPAEDPQGKQGPTLDQVLRKKPYGRNADICPYGRKCTYGNKCKYRHPEREQHFSYHDSGIGSFHSVPDIQALQNRQSAPGALHRTSHDEQEFSSLPENSSSLYQSPILRKNVQYSKMTSRHSMPEQHSFQNSLSSNFAVARGPASLNQENSTMRHLIAPSYLEDAYNSLPDNSMPMSSMSSDLSDTSFALSELSIPEAGSLNRVEPDSMAFSEYQSQPSSFIGQLTQHEQHGGAQPPHYFNHSDRYNLQQQQQMNPQFAALAAKYAREGKPFVQDDPRYDLYYHLKGLFPEPLVRKVMNIHPSETDPNKICAAILAMNQQKH